MSTLAIVIDCWYPASPEFASLTPTALGHYQHVIHNINHELAYCKDITRIAFATYGASALHPDLAWTTLDHPHISHYNNMVISDVELLLTGINNILVMGCSWKACLFDRPVGIRRLFPVLGQNYNIQIIPECCQNGNDHPNEILSDLEYGLRKNHWLQPYHWPNRYTLNHHNPSTVFQSNQSWPRFDLLKPISKLFSRR